MYHDDKNKPNQMSDKKQTAVGWIIEQLHNGRELSTISSFAKNMEKEQIVAAWDISRRDIDWQANGEQYYTETYNTNQ